MDMYGHVLRENNLIVKNSLRNNHAPTCYEQVKKGLSYFYPKQNVENDGIQTHSLKLCMYQKLNSQVSCVCSHP